MTFRALLASHTLAFVAGFAAGKLINQDELEMYRSAHESSLTRAKRRASAVGLGILALGSIIVIVRVTSRPRSSGAVVSV
jgi:hypothetical protein